MAYDSACWNGGDCLLRFVDYLHLVKLKHMIQEILVYIFVIIAVLVLVKKYFYKTKRKKSDCDTDCNC